MRKFIVLYQRPKVRRRFCFMSSIVRVNLKLPLTPRNSGSFFVEFLSRKPSVEFEILRVSRYARWTANRIFVAEIIIIIIFYRAIDLSIHHSNESAKVLSSRDMQNSVLSKIQALETIRLFVFLGIMRGSDLSWNLSGLSLENLSSFVLIYQFEKLRVSRRF